MSQISMTSCASNIMDLRNCIVSNRQDAKYAKASFMTPRFLGALVDILGELGFFAVQMRNS